MEAYSFGPTVWIPLDFDVLTELVARTLAVSLLQTFCTHSVQALKGPWLALPQWSVHGSLDITMLTHAQLIVLYSTIGI